MRAYPLTYLLLALAARPLHSADSSSSLEDAYLWLEDIHGKRSLDWVEQRNDATAKRLTASPRYQSLYRDALAVLGADSRVPEVEPHGPHLYNFWQDTAHPRGHYRRTTLDEFRQANPRWETVLDVDALARREGVPWAFGGADWQRPGDHRCLIALSPGGGDARELREFDLRSSTMLADGFVLPAAKSRVNWRDANSLYVATDFGPGTLTAAGYPRIVKLWKRDTPLSEATLIHQTPASSVSVAAERLYFPDGHIDLVTERLTFWTARFYQITEAGLEPLAIPSRAAVVDAFRGRLVIRLKEDWTNQGRTFPSGSVVIADLAALRGGGGGAVELIVAGTGAVVVRDARVTPGGILVNLLDNVRGRLVRFVPDAAGWRAESVAFPERGTLKIVGLDDETGDAWVRYESFTTPPALYRLSSGAMTPERFKAQAPSFNGAEFQARQWWATSADGTRVPYFVVAPKNLQHDGTNPVWMFSYGGFENALTPSYSGSYEDLKGAYGKLWLERGGVFVLANIRGGGEFGPAWHRTALRENRYKVFEDFEAVARDLVDRKVTSPRRLGIEGRSNGGLLVAATMWRHPELYGAVVCGNPLLDMRRYHRLLAGASWVAEYGDPDNPDHWAYLQKYSPYQLVRPGQSLPPVLFYTTTRDDRVHPGHARKMAAKMEAMGYAVDFYENTEGGHHGNVTNEQLATRLARTYAFLWQHLGADSTR